MAIENISPEQVAHVTEYQSKWRKLALSTTRLDFDKAKKAVDVAIVALSGNEKLEVTGTFSEPLTRVFALFTHAACVATTVPKTHREILDVRIGCIPATLTVHVLQGQGTELLHFNRHDLPLITTPKHHMPSDQKEG